MYYNTPVRQRGAAVSHENWNAPPILESFHSRSLTRKLKVLHRSSHFFFSSSYDILFLFSQKLITLTFCFIVIPRLLPLRSHIDINFASKFQLLTPEIRQGKALQSPVRLLGWPSSYISWKMYAQLVQLYWTSTSEYTIDLLLPVE